MSAPATGRGAPAFVGSLALAGLALLAWPLSTAAAQDGGDLRKQAQNPLATLISLPFEQSVDFGAPDGSAYILNVQPVIPINLGDWNLINRTIIPFASVSGDIGGLPGLPEGVQGGRVWGLGDINHTTFLSPADSGPITWGIGPSIQLPTATDPQLGTEKWSAGPSAVFLVQPAPWSVALLVRQIWSFAGKSDRDKVNQFLIQPFINYNLDDGWYLVSEPAFVANWEAKSDQCWTAQIGGGFGRLFTIGEQPINIRAQGFYNVERPDNAPEWVAKLSIAFLFPK